MFTEEEKSVLKIAINNAIGGCNRSAAKAGLELVKQAYAKQALVLSVCLGKLNDQGKVAARP